MRIRHLGLLNTWQAARSEADGFPPRIDDAADDPMEMNATAFLLWFWRVASWRVTASLSWSQFYMSDIDDTPVGFDGSGSFDVVMESDGPLQFEPLRVGSGALVERDLLHRLRFQNFALGSGGGDFTDISVALQLGAGITRYIGQSWVPTYRLDFAGSPVDVVNRTEAIGSMAADGTLTFNFGTDPDNLAGTIQFSPETYYPYLDAGGLNPIWDTATGAQLLDPRQDDPN